MIVNLMRKASTSTGLKTVVNVIWRLDKTGRNATDEIKEYVCGSIKFDALLPK